MVNLRDWTRGNKLSAGHLNEPIALLRTLMSLPGSGVGKEGTGDTRGRVFDLTIGKIVSSSYTDERYLVTAQYILATDLTSDQITTADLTPMQSEQVTFTVTNLPELGGNTHTLAEGRTVIFASVYDGQAQANRIHVMSEVSAGLIPVLVSQTGGSNGTQTTAATWTYNVTDVASNPIAGGPFSPSWQRPKGKRIAATHGNGYYDPSGNFVLEQVDEVKDTGVCPESEA